MEWTSSSSLYLTRLHNQQYSASSAHTTFIPCPPPNPDKPHSPPPNKRPSLLIVWTHSGLLAGSGVVDMKKGHCWLV